MLDAVQFAQPRLSVELSSTLVFAFKTRVGLVGRFLVQGDPSNCQ